MADVTLTYQGAAIAELSESGSKTIETAGKYCEADILLEYVKSGGGLPTGMTNIGSGTISFANRTTSNTQINHGLDFTPKVVTIWTADTITQNQDILFCSLIRELFTNAGTTKTQRQLMCQDQTKTYQLESAIYAETNASFFITDTYFNIGHGIRYYSAGKTYFWFAFA